MTIIIPVIVKICSPDEQVINNFKNAWNYLDIFVPKSEIRYEPEFIVKKKDFFTWYNKGKQEWDYFKELEELPQKGALRMLMLDCWKTGYQSPWGLAGGTFGIGKEWYEPSIFIAGFSSSFTALNKCGAWWETKAMQHELHLSLEGCAEESSDYIVSHSAEEYINNKERAIAGAGLADAHRPIWENTCPYGYSSVNYCNFDCWSWRECKILKSLAKTFLKEIGATKTVTIECDTCSEIYVNGKKI